MSRGKMRASGWGDTYFLILHYLAFILERRNNNMLAGFLLLLVFGIAIAVTEFHEKD